MGRVLAATFLLASAVSWPFSSAKAEELVATLTLDGLSFVSFANQHVYSIPGGSTMRFRFGAPNAGSRGITIEPEDVNLGQLRLRTGDGFMQFGLVREAFGHARRNADGTVAIEVDALVSVILNHSEHGGAKTVRVHFTTETAEATGLDGLGRRSITGMRAASGSKGVQLVGAATADETDYPAPGAAVLVVLSGVFDELPSFE